MGEFHTVAKASEVAPGDMMLVDVDGEEIVIANVGGSTLRLATRARMRVVPYRMVSSKATLLPARGTLLHSM